MIGDVAADEPVAVGQPPDLAAGRVGLVVDLADDLFDDVLDGDDPDDAAVLVDDDRHRRALALQVGEQVVQRLGLGDDHGLAHERHQRRLRPLGHQRLGQAVGVHDAAHAVAVVVLGDDQPRVAGGDAAPQRRLDVFGQVDRDDRRDRRHHLARLLLVQVEDAAEHAGLARVELAARARLADQDAQLLGRRALLDAACGSTRSSRRIALATVLSSEMKGFIPMLKAFSGRATQIAIRSGWMIE